MKRKAIITLMLIVVMVLSATIAYATNFTSNLGSVTSAGWTVTDGTFGGTFGGSTTFGVYSTITGTGYARAIHPMNQDANGTHAFSLEIDFRLNNLTQGIWVGVANQSGSGTSGNQLMVGYPGYGTNFLTSVDGTSGTTQTMSTTAAPSNNTNYKVLITSNDGNSITFTLIDQDTQGTLGTATRTMPGGIAAYAAIQINNRAETHSPGTSTSPVVNYVYFTDNGGSSTPTPTATPTATPTTTPPTNTAAILANVQSFYANQPVVHMSNQSVVYYPNGSIKQVITGNQTATPKPTTVAAVTPTANPSIAATTTPTVIPPTVTAVPSTPAATQTKSPGFEIVLAAIGMIAALALVSRKK